MSDLQCPATLILVGWGPVPREPDGVEPVPREAHGELPRLAELADELRTRRIAAVFSGRDASTLVTAQALALRLGVVHRSIDGLEPLPAGPAGAAVPSAGPVDADATGARHRAALDALADLHRGETVLVVTDARVLTTLWPATPRPHGEDALSPYRLVTVQVDGDGWRLLGPPGGG
jgi:2,3-bisphosphoglycerate-dependent phosphoglycerate mutase